MNIAIFSEKVEEIKQRILIDEALGNLATTRLYIHLSLNYFQIFKALCKYEWFQIWKCSCLMTTRLGVSHQVEKYKWFENIPFSPFSTQLNHDCKEEVLDTRHYWTKRNHDLYLKDNLILDHPTLLYLPTTITISIPCQTWFKPIRKKYR